MEIKNYVETFNEHLATIRKDTSNELLKEYIVDKAVYEIEIVWKYRDYETKRTVKRASTRYRFYNHDNKWHNLVGMHEHENVYTSEQLRAFIIGQIEFASWYDIEDNYMLVTTYGCVMFILYI